MLVAPIVAAFAVALVGGQLYLRWAARLALDVPNQRSSHTRPTPRGGGLVIVVGFFVGLGVWLMLGGTLSPRALGWLAGALVVATVSFVDDLRSLPAAPRLIAHVAAAVILALAAVQERDVTLVALPLGLNSRQPVPHEYPLIMPCW